MECKIHGLREHLFYYTTGMWECEMCKYNEVMLEKEDKRVGP